MTMGPCAQSEDTIRLILLVFNGIETAIITWLARRRYRADRERRTLHHELRLHMQREDDRLDGE